MKQILRTYILGLTRICTCYVSLLILIAVMVLLSLSSAPARAGMIEAKTAYDAKDYKTAFKEYLPLAEAGNAEAQNKIGLMYRYALGRERDYELAVKWLIKAVDNGRLFSLISLGYMAGKGQGMPKSIENRNCYNRFAAERGDETAQWSLYLSLRKDFTTMSVAREWLRRAVKQGEPAAMARHGYVLIVNFFRQDKTEGLMYMWLGIQNGNDPEVSELLSEVVGDDPEMMRQLEKAKIMARQWKPVKEVPPTDLPPIDLSKCER